MADFGITETGYNRKTFNDLVQEMEDRARALFGPEIQLDENSFFGLLIRNYAFFQDEIWQLQDQTYNGAYIDTAEGVQLDAVVKYADVSRNQSVASTGTVTFTGADSTLIPEGTLVASGDIQFTTDFEGFLITVDVDIAVTAVELGTDSNVPATTIDTLINPIFGIDSITNDDATTGGQDEETDSELRSRYFLTLQTGGKATLDAIRSDILQVTGVRTATIIENVTNVTDGDGRPPHSFESVVDGGDDTAVAQAILDSKAAGIDTFGSVTEIVQDDSGTDRTINFSRPVEFDIWVNITVTTSANYPVDGDDQVNDAIVDFINALLIGDDVVVTQLIAESFTIAGVIDSFVEISDDNITFDTTNIVIDDDEKAQTDSGKVVVTS